MDTSTLFTAVYRGNSEEVLRLLSPPLSLDVNAKNVCSICERKEREKRKGEEVREKKKVREEKERSGGLSLNHTRTHSNFFLLFFSRQPCV